MSVKIKIYASTVVLRCSTEDKEAYIYWKQCKQINKDI